MTYKALTVDTSSVEPLPEDLHEIVHSQVKEIFYAGGMRQPNRQLLMQMSPDVSRFYWRHISCNDSEREDIFLRTIGQCHNKEWHDARYPRISASTSQKLASSIKAETTLKYFFESPLDNDNFRYGRETEAEAIDEYKSLKTDYTVLESGLVICRQMHWLAATPDALVIDDNGELIILEVKCPISGRTGTLNVTYIDEDGNLNTKDKLGRAYYAQIQVQLIACDVKRAHLYVYGQFNSQLVLVERDEQFI